MLITACVKCVRKKGWNRGNAVNLDTRTLGPKLALLVSTRTHRTLKLFGLRRLTAWRYNRIRNATSWPWRSTSDGRAEQNIISHVRKPPYSRPFLKRKFRQSLVHREPVAECLNGFFVLIFENHNVPKTVSRCELCTAWYGLDRGQGWPG